MALFHPPLGAFKKVNSKSLILQLRAQSELSRLDYKLEGKKSSGWITNWKEKNHLCRNKTFFGDFQTLWIRQGFAIFKDTLWRCWWFVAGHFLNKGISSSTTKRFSRFYISNTWKLARLLLKGHHLNSLWVCCILKL